MRQLSESRNVVFLKNLNINARCALIFNHIPHQVFKYSRARLLLMLTCDLPSFFCLQLDCQEGRKTDRMVTEKRSQVFRICYHQSV